MSRTVSGVVCESVSGEVSGRNGCEFPKDSSPYTHHANLAQRTPTLSLSQLTHLTSLSHNSLSLLSRSHSPVMVSMVVARMAAVIVTLVTAGSVLMMAAVLMMMAAVVLTVAAGAMLSPLAVAGFFVLVA